MADQDHHHHGHGDHHHGHDKASTDNKAFWNTMAASYDNRYERTIEQLIREIQKRKDFIGADWVDDDEGEGEADAEGKKKEVRLLDYACGTGLVSRALAQYTTQCVGVDIADKMVDSYNARAENQGLAEHEMHAYHGNLLAADPDPNIRSPRFHNFDVAAVGLGFHHFADPETAATRLAERLRPGGVLFLLDFLPHERVDAAAAAAAHTVHHHGFTEERMRAIFEGAGVGKGFAIEEIGSGVVFHGAGGEGQSMTRRVFIARGEKA